MRRVLRAAALAVLLAVPARADRENFTQELRGRYLATVGDCIACHTGPVGQHAGGRAIETPFGVINSANLTPDERTGIGRWTADEFWNAMHRGRRPDGTPLYPAFPYPYYTNVTREDSDAIFAFFRSLPPVENAVDRNTLPFPFNVRTAMHGWNLLFFAEAPFKPDPNQSAEWNRGGYLVQGLGHCSACHTPRNALGGEQSGRFLQGGPLQGWWAPNITNDARRGLGSWSVEDVVEYLKTGRNGRSMASGPMAEAVGYSTSLMEEPDLRAIAPYLKGLPGGDAPAPAPVAATEPRMRAGAALYLDNCAACHTQAGVGVERIFPRLAGSQVVQQDGPDTLIRVVLSGVRAVATNAAPTGPAMPSFGWRLSDPQVADLLTFVRNSWGNVAPAVEPDAVRTQRERLESASPG